MNFVSCGRLATKDDRLTKLRSSMKKLIRSMLQSVASAAIGPMHRELVRKLSICETEIRTLQSELRALTINTNPPCLTKQAQIALHLTYKEMVRRRVAPLAGFREGGFRCSRLFE